MYVPNLDALYLTDDERTCARREIEKMAYDRWQSDGCPMRQDRNFWRAAEIEWIQYRYVPDRDCVRNN